MDLPAGWLTDLAVLRGSGARITDLGDHLLIVSPDNPGYHWGNFLLVTDPCTRAHAARWVGQFRAAFPDAEHLCIGLPEEPEAGPWSAAGLMVSGDQVLSAAALPAQRPVPAGYDIRVLASSADWAGAAQADVAENLRTAEQPVAGFATFTAARWATRRAMSEAGAAAFVGAFRGPDCVANLGIVLCGPDAQGREVARYQSVLTDAEHRGRGLAGHLIGVAARWAQARGARRWVIVTESDNQAGRLYRSLGFRPDATTWQAERITGPAARRATPGPVGSGG
ncbi:MAG: GNAT family N-acetyltransferase [Candidatus Nanopelagicales bacterium]